MLHPSIRISPISLFVLGVFALAFTGCSKSEPYAVTGTESTSLSNARPILPATDALIPVNGKGRYLIGANYPWHRYGDDFGGTPEATNNDWSKIESDFDTMHEQ